MEQAQNICKNCGNNFKNKYCNKCGEKIYTNHDKSLIYVFEEGLHFITHFEGKFLTTLKSIVLSPGKLSEDYCNGIRKKYFKPLSFFLLLIILYLIYPLFKGLNVALVDHTHSFYSDYAKHEIESLMRIHHWDMMYLSEKYQITSEKVSKFLLLIIIPIFAIFNAIFLYKKKILFFDHFIFVAEISSFFILWGFLIFPSLLYIAERLFPSLPSHLMFYGEFFTLVVILIPFYIYLIIGIKRFYKLNIYRSILYALLFGSAFMLFLMTFYRFILFYIAIHLVH